MREEIERLEVSCPHCEKGCTWEGNVLNLESHQKDACKLVSKKPIQLRGNHCRQFAEMPTCCPWLLHKNGTATKLYIYCICLYFLDGNERSSKAYSRKCIVASSNRCSTFITSMECEHAAFLLETLKTLQFLACFSACMHCSLLLKRAVQLSICEHYLCENGADKL